MGEPTIYRRPTLTLPGRPPSKQDIQKWEKHRKHKGKDPSLPVTRKN